jgi:arylsulfatase A
MQMKFYATAIPYSSTQNELKQLNMKTKFALQFIFRKRHLPWLTIASFFFQSCQKTESLKPTDKMAGSAYANNPAVTGKPNIIIILGDDIGYDALRVNGNQTFQTPNIDHMAQTGMRFTQCYGSPLCSPSRVMFVTGKYNFRNYTEWGVLNPNAKTFATLAKSAGYATYVAGKWQLDGGNDAIHSFGFDDYCVWYPINDGPIGSHYKNPNIYENGAFLSKTETEGKYGDDIFTSRVLSFIKKNKANNFFVYFPITLCHFPYNPTPDDPQFAGWKTTNPSDPAYFPSMIKYMDKKVGQIIDSLQAWNLYNNTIVMFVGDNGTPHDIFYIYNGKLTEGDKSNSTSGGTHVPLIVTWPNRIAGGQVNNNLVDFTDFLPTVGEAAQISIPSTYGVVDGKSFYKQLTGASSTPRSWIFCHYRPNENHSTKDLLKRWMQNTTYKLYDSVGTPINYRFYNIVKDPLELTPIKSGNMTNSEKQLYTQFLNTMNTLP